MLPRTAAKQNQIFSQRTHHLITDFMSFLLQQKISSERVVFPQNTSGLWWLRTQLSPPRSIQTHSASFAEFSLTYVIYTHLACSYNILSELSNCFSLASRPLRPLIANSVSLIKVQKYRSLFKPAEHICGWSPSWGEKIKQKSAGCLQFLSALVMNLLSVFCCTFGCSVF